MKVRELTQAQEQTIAVLDAIGDWADSQKVSRLGGFTQSLVALTTLGLVEERELPQDSDLSITQWRLAQFEQVH